MMTPWMTCRFRGNMADEPLQLQPLGALRKPTGARSVFVITKYPKDHPFFETYPDKFIVRRWETSDNVIAHPKQWCGVVDTLEEAHSYITPGMECVKAPFSETPLILEVWL